jgi:hypothetical protein
MGARLATSMGVMGVALFALFIAAMCILSLIPEQPPRPIKATIVRVTYTIRGRSIRGTVEFKGDDGRTGFASFFPVELACRVGDRVNAEEVGINLRLRPPACRHVPRSPWIR